MVIGKLEIENRALLWLHDLKLISFGWYDVYEVPIKKEKRKKSSDFIALLKFYSNSLNSRILTP
jgi:hypothetical protein